ncbi:MAG: hypothetical protein IJQ02_16205 [Oscillospiraceae bacterium]|nr:hypothetical protein [Oscillospiraceae bacterium]
MNDALASLACDSKNGEYIFLTRAEQYYLVNQKLPDDLIAFPIIALATLEETISYVKAYLADHPDAGFDITKRVIE